MHKRFFWWTTGLAIVLAALSYSQFDRIRTALGLLSPTIPVHRVVDANDGFSVNLPLTLLPQTELNDTLRLIQDRLATGGVLSFKQMTDYFIWNQEDAFIQNYFERNEANEENRAELEHLVKTARQRFFSVVPNTLRSLTPPQIKQELEHSLLDSFNNRSLLLTREKANLVELLTENRGQDYSLTILYHLVARQMGRAAYSEKNFVTIFTEGRIYPGYFEKTAKGLRLFGLDMQRDGLGGPIYFGKLRDLSDEIEVIDADLFLLTNLFRGRVAKSCAVREKLRTLSRERWGLKQELFSPSACKEKSAIKYLVDAEIRGSKNITRGQDPLSLSQKSRSLVREVGGSLFAFGSPRMLPGASTRLRGNATRDLSVQYTRIDVEPIAELVQTLDSLQTTR